jgi:hypothetical protein
MCLYLGTEGVFYIEDVLILEIASIIFDFGYSTITIAIC